MLPNSTINVTEQTKTMPSKTYKLDFVNNRITGYVDGKEAIKQVIYKILQTERYAYPIYTSRYGSEIEKLIGKNMDVVKADLKRVVTEALLTDNRIRSVESFRMVQNGDTLLVNFKVDTVEGEIITNDLEVKT